MKIAKFKVTAQLITQSLAMPDETIIHNIERDENDPNVFVFTIEHPDFKEIKSLLTIPELSPVIHADYEKRPSTWLTFDWGTPNE